MKCFLSGNMVTHILQKVMGHHRVTCVIEENNWQYANRICYQIMYKSNLRDYSKVLFFCKATSQQCLKLSSMKATYETDLL